MNKIQCTKHTSAHPCAYWNDYRTCNYCISNLYMLLPYSKSEVSRDFYKEEVKMEFKQEGLEPVLVNENKRVYHYGDGFKIEIKNVIEILVRPSGNHRLKDSKGKHYIIAAGWRCIEIDGIEGWGDL